MCHDGAVSNHISISVCVLFRLRHGCAWLAARAPVCKCLCLQPAGRGRAEGGGCMVCSENYFSTATGWGPVYFPTLGRPCHYKRSTKIDWDRPPPSAPTTVDSRHLSSCPKQQGVDTASGQERGVARKPMSAGIADRCWAASPAPRTLSPSTKDRDDHGRTTTRKAMCALIDCKQSIVRQLLKWQRASTRSAVNPSLSISHHNLPFPEATEIAASLFLT